MATMNSEVAEKIRKILALAGNNSSEAEIAVAMSKARAVLAAHGLTVEEFAGSQSPDEADESLEPMTSEGLAVVKATDAWAYQLARGVGRLTNTEPLYWQSRQGGKQIVMAGQATDLIVARELFSYLYERAQSLAANAMRSECPAWYGRGEKTVWRRTFLKGFADRVDARAAEQRRQERAEAAEQTPRQEQPEAAAEPAAANASSNLPAVRWHAIVQRKEAALESFKREEYKRVKVRSSSSSQSRDSGGYASGYAAGGSVGLAARRLVS